MYLTSNQNGPKMLWNGEINLAELQPQQFQLEDTSFTSQNETLTPLTSHKQYTEVSRQYQEISWQ